MSNPSKVDSTWERDTYILSALRSTLGKWSGELNDLMKSIKVLSDVLHFPNLYFCSGMIILFNCTISVKKTRRLTGMPNPLNN